MQRLLRGRVFYIVLTGFVIGLFYYVESTRLGRWLPPQMPGAQEEVEQTEWWTEDVDPAVIKQAVATDPLIRIMVVVLSVFIAGLTLGGIGLLIWGLLTGRIRTLWGASFHRVPPWTFGELWRITLLVFLIGILLQFSRLAMAGPWPALADDFNLWVNVSMLLLHGMLLLTIFTFAAGKASPPVKALGLSGHKLSRAVSIGFRGYAAIFPWLLLLLFLVASAANFFGIEPPKQPIHEMIFMEQRPAVLGLTIILTCLVGPFAEETFFRGVVFAALRGRTSRWVAMFVSGALFSALHTNLIGFIPILLLGCLLADLYERTGSLASPIAIHILHNTLLLSLSFTYRWSI